MLLRPICYLIFLKLTQILLCFKDVAHSLRELLAYDGDVEEDLCLTFQASIGQNGKMITEDLMKGEAEVEEGPILVQSFFAS